MATFTVNGESRTFDGDPGTPLLWYLRDVTGLTGTKYGCGQGVCGACTIHIDGVAVRRTGDETFRLCRQLLDGIVTVSTDDVCAAVKDIFDDTRSIAEPAGALALAGLRRHVAGGLAPSGTLIAIDSGANTNFDRLRHVVERVEIGERGEALLAVQIPEAPGSYRQFTALSTIKEEEGVPKWQDMVKNLVAGHESVIRTAREALPTAQESGDESSVSLISDRLRIHEKTAWMLRSLLE